MNRVIPALIILLIAIVVGVLFLPPSLLFSKQSSPSLGVVFGFLPDYRFDGADVDFIVPRVSHLCLFGSDANPKTGSMNLRLPAAEKLERIVHLSKVFGTKLYLSFGGAGRSEFFAALSAHPKRYDQFILDLTEKVLERNIFTGVELNWMYPQTLAHMQTLKQLVEFLHTKGLEVSMAVPPDAPFFETISTIEFDFFHLMAYQAGIGKDLKFTRGLLEEVPSRRRRKLASKMTLGIPFYGQSGKAFEEKFTHNVDDFESVELIQQKKALAMDQFGMAGISIWELGQDCRVKQVGSHVQTCPNGEIDSLLGQLVGKKR